MVVPFINNKEERCEVRHHRENIRENRADIETDTQINETEEKVQK